MTRISIFQAAQSGDVANVRSELSAGVDPNEWYQGQTALMLASERGHAGVCELLLNNGARVNAVDSYNRTPLFLATAFQHFDAARVLIEHGADPGVRCNLGGENCMDVAKLRSNISLQRLLNVDHQQTTSPTKAKFEEQLHVPASEPTPQSSLTDLGAHQQPSLLANSYPQRAPPPEQDESRRPEPLSTNNVW